MNIEEMTVKQLVELAKQMGIAVPSGAKKAELIELIEAKDQENAESAQEAAQDQKDTGGEQEGAQTTEDAGGDQEATQKPEKSHYMAYVGPSIPGGVLSYGKILYGTDTSIREYLAPVLECYPKVEGLLVPMDNMAWAMKDVKNPKKLMYHRAQELASEVKRNGG